MALTLTPEEANKEMDEIVQDVFRELTFELENEKLVIGTSQSALPGSVIDFGNAAVLAAGVERAQMIVDGIDHLVAEQFEAQQKALE